MPSCSTCKKIFEIREVDRQFYKRFDAPEPEMCPECRLQHKLCFRNERTLYKRTSSLSGENIVSIYSPDSRHVVYSQKEWWGDKWDGLEYGQDFDFSRPFFEQFQELLLKVPRIALFNVNPTNSDFCQQAYDNKNCYLCMVIEKCEDCMYISHSNGIRDSFDCNLLHDCELCYDCLDSNKLYACIACKSCQNSSDLIHCYDCIGCQSCVGCYGLRNKKYYIMNEPYSKEDYDHKIKALELNKYSKFLNCRRYFLELSRKMPHRASRNLNCEDCSGNFLINCKNAYHCYDSFELEDCSYSTWIFNSHDCMDVYGMGHGAFVLEGLGVEAVTNCAFNTFVSDSSDAFYSDCCFHCMNIFGCAGLRGKKYCILNKQYKPEEYEVMKARIIEHMKVGRAQGASAQQAKNPALPVLSAASLSNDEWGRFFPISLSPYSYNETAGNYRFPLSKEEVLGRGWKWREADPKDYMKQSYVLPDDVKEIDGKVCEQVLACLDCGKNYKIMPKELAFYKKMYIPVPRKCLDCRFLERFKLRNPRKLWERGCGKCGGLMQTSYSPQRPETVYCEKCYVEVVK